MEATVTTCRECGEPFTATTDSRLRHRVIFGHTPAAELPVVAPEKATNRKCERDEHAFCGGGLLHRGKPAECGCRCHVQVPETCENRGNAKAAPTSQVVEHLSRGLTPNKEGL